MNIEKIRNLGPDELLKEQRDAADQLFRLKFQLKMGQTTGVKKMRDLRKDLARIKTIARQRELGIVESHVENATGSTTVAPAGQATPTASSAAKSAAGKKSAASKSRKTSAKKKTPAAPKKAAAKKKTKAKK